MPFVWIINGKKDKYILELSKMVYKYPSLYYEDDGTPAV